MREHYESCRLSGDEIAALLSMAGKTSMVAVRSDEPQQVEEESLWSACCTLQRDGLIHQDKEGFRIDKDLARVIRPMLRGDRALVLTPGSDTGEQVIYYCADQVTAMERTRKGRYILSCMEMAELIEDLEERVELDYSERIPQNEPMPAPVADLEASWDVLLQGAVLLLEQFDLDSGRRTGWARGVRQGLFHWLEWSWDGHRSCAPFTRDLLKERLYILEGGTEI